MNRQKRHNQTKQEFIEATKKIIRKDGVEAVSARHISKITGYSYATLYNYFKDIDSLLTYAAVDFLEDSYRHIIMGIEKLTTVREQIIYMSKRYFSYMFHHPSIFKVIFINNFGQEIEKMSYKLIPKVTLLLKDKLNQLEDEPILKDKTLTFELISSSLHAKLMFAIFKRNPLTEIEHLKQIEYELVTLLKEDK